MVNPTNPQGFAPETTAGFSNLAATAGFFLNVAATSDRPIVESAMWGRNIAPTRSTTSAAAMTWSHGKHTIRFGGEYLYENRLEINTYETFTSSTTQTCPTNASGLFACGANQGNASGIHAARSALSALTVNVPQYEEVHVRMAPFGFFLQDEWHVRPNLTIDVGLRYDYDPAVKLLSSNGETVNALEPASRAVHHRIERRPPRTLPDAARRRAPPCVPGGLNSANPAFKVTVGGVTYNTLNNIVVLS